MKHQWPHISLAHQAMCMQEEMGPSRHPLQETMV